MMATYTCSSSLIALILFWLALTLAEIKISSKSKPCKKSKSHKILIQSIAANLLIPCHLPTCKRQQLNSFISLNLRPRGE